MAAEKRRERPKGDNQLSPNTRRSESRNEPNNGAGEGGIPEKEKDSQSKLSKDPTRKNEAQQGDSDLRKRVD